MEKWKAVEVEPLRNEARIKRKFHIRPNMCANEADFKTIIKPNNRSERR